MTSVRPHHSIGSPSYHQVHQVKGFWLRVIKRTDTLPAKIMDYAEALLVNHTLIWFSFISQIVVRNLFFQRCLDDLRAPTKKPKNGTWEIITAHQFVLRHIFFVSVSHFVKKNVLNVATFLLICKHFTPRCSRQVSPLFQTEIYKFPKSSCKKGHTFQSIFLGTSTWMK